MAAVRGIITKIDPEKKASGPGSKTFIRVYFELHKNDDPAAWAKTDLCPQFRNFTRWKHLLKEGAMIDGLVLKSKATVDADSLPRLVKSHEGVELPEPAPETPQRASSRVFVKSDEGWYLALDNPGQPHENDQYTRDRVAAHGFRDADAARAAIKKYGLDPKEYKMKSPKNG